MRERAGMSPGVRAARLPYWLGILALVAILAFFLWQEHRAHAFGAAIELALLACPLLHLFMHRGHGAHDLSERGAAFHEHGSSQGDSP